jgi:hypothetical protein
VHGTCQTVGVGCGRGIGRGVTWDAGVASWHGENDEQGTGSLPTWVRMAQTAWATKYSAQSRKRENKTLQKLIRTKR